MGSEVTLKSDGIMEKVSNDDESMTTEATQISNQ